MSSEGLLIGSGLIRTFGSACRGPRHLNRGGGGGRGGLASSAAL